MSKLRFLAILATVGVCKWAVARAQHAERVFAIELQSPQEVSVDHRQFAVLPDHLKFREDAFKTFFNPTNSTPPFFQIFDESFQVVLGSNPAIYQISSNNTFAFAHEAPIYVSDSETVYFASNGGGALGMSDLDHNNQVGFISVKDAEAKIRLLNGTFTVDVPVNVLPLPDSVQMTNGGTGPVNSSLLLVNSGRGLRPPNIVRVNPGSPQSATVLLDNYYGRQFNSLNDIKVHPPSGKLFFTDPEYGFLSRFRLPPLMPNQVYRFDPVTGAVRVVADGFDKPNGIAFTADGKTAYITDTGAAEGFLGTIQTRPATIYAFDVDLKSHAFKNRRVFAYVDAGIPDGLQVDTNGNVYAGCGDGVQVWNDQGDLLGKIFLGRTSSNFVFAGKGRLVLLAETQVFLVKIAAEGVSLSGPK